MGIDPISPQDNKPKWHFVGFVYDNINKVATFHVNDAFGHANATTNSSVEYSDFDGDKWMGYWNNSAIRIGSHVDAGYSNSFSGVISCLQVYNRALNVAELDQKRDCKDAR